jgi:uncharacterized protein (TIGR00725 family)
MTPRLQIAVVGPGDAGSGLEAAAERVGELLARSGAVLLTGGRSGVMAAAGRGARAAQGLVVGVLPGPDARSSPPNPSIEVAVFTGLGQARNLLVVLSARAIIAIGGGWGTLSEIALALKHGRPVILLESWRLERPDGRPEPNLHLAASPEHAVELALRLARD